MEPHPIRVVVTDDLERKRLTVFFRLLLAIPHFIWLFLWTIAALLAAVANWFATLVRGVSPLILHRFLAAYVRYTTQFYAYLYLAASPYPGFDGTPGYPVDAEIDPPERQRRWTVAFRLLLALPALLLATTLAGGGIPGGGGGPAGGRGDDDAGWFFFAAGASLAATIAFLAWFACLARGRMPRGFRDAIAYAVRYSAQAGAYAFLLTDRYPDSSPSEPRPPQPAPRHAVTIAVTDDARRSRLTVFFRFLLALPHFVWLALWAAAALVVAVPAWFVAVALGRLPAALHRFYAAFVRYGTHVGAFVYLAANPFPGFTGAPGYPVDVEIAPSDRQSRPTIAFRFLLAVPALLVAGALGSAAGIAAVYGWFASLALGRMPTGLRDLVVYSLRYGAQVYAYVLLLAGRYPDSGPREGAGDEEPAEAELSPST